MAKVKMAYLLLAHKSPEQLNLFIEQLIQYGDCDVYIHVDKKNTELLSKIKKYSNVYTCSVYDVRWGSFEIVKAAIELMKMVEKSGKYYTHMYLGSGQDFLVKKGMYEFIEQHPSNVFLHIVKEVKNNDRESARYRVSWPHRLMIRNDLHPYRFIRIVIQILCKFGIVISKNKNKLVNQVRFFEGRTWFVAPIEVLRYIVDYLDENQDYVKFWENSLASDLMFFQTIIMNSKYANVVQDELMYVNFGKTFSKMNHPVTITLDDVEKIGQGNWYFARKFEEDKSRSAIQYYLELTKCE